MRGEYRRPWLKLWAIECLEGSIRWQLTAEERGTWYDLLILARLTGHDGRICDRDKHSLPHDFLANRLNITLELLERTIAKCKSEGRLSEGEEGIVITNWTQYQSEYERQKKYRVKPELDGDPDKYVKGKYGHLVQR